MIYNLIDYVYIYFLRFVFYFILYELRHGDSIKFQANEFHKQTSTNDIDIVNCFILVEHM